MGAFETDEGVTLSTFEFSKLPVAYVVGQEYTNLVERT